MKEFIDEIEGVSVGTDINRANLMAVQEFIAKTTVISNGAIVETNSDGHTLTTTFGENTVTQVFVGEKTITKTTTFNADGTVTEVIS